MENSVDCRQEMLLAEAEAVGAKRARENERDRPRGSSYGLVAVMSSYGRINPDTWTSTLLTSRGCILITGRCDRKCCLTHGANLPAHGQAARPERGTNMARCSLRRPALGQKMRERTKERIASRAYPTTCCAWLCKYLKYVIWSEKFFYSDFNTKQPHPDHTAGLT